MRRDIFRRGVRMISKYGEIEGKDPLYGEEVVFTPPAPPMPGSR